jgi:hypothetical protein
MPRVCKPIQPLNKRAEKKDIPLNTAKKYVDNFYKKLSYTAGLLSDGNVEFLKMRQMLDTALHGMINNEISQVGRSDFFASWMSAVVGWRREFFSDGFSLGGSINERLLRGTNAAYNVFSVWVQSHAQPLVTRHTKYLSDLLPNLSNKEIEILLHDAAIVGGTEDLIEALGESVGAQNHLNKRLTDFFTRLQGLGLDDAAIKQVYTNGKEYSGIYKQGQAYLQSVGVNIKRLEGYVPIVFDNRIKQAVSSKIGTFDELMGATFGGEVASSVVGSNAKKARLAYIDYVINDVDITYEKFRKLIPDLTKETVVDWSMDADKFKLEVLAPLSPTAIEKLLDESVLSRIPSMHSTIVDLLVRREGLPIGLAEDILLTNPQKALEQWAGSLETITRESFAFNDLLTNGIEKGWVVDLAVAELHPNQFIKLGTVPGVVDKYPGAIGIAVGQQYVHKIVARQLAAVLELNANPISTSILGQAIDKFSQFSGYLKKGVLGNPVSAIAQYTQNVVQVVSAVGSPMFMPKATTDVFKVLSGGLEALSDLPTIKFGDETVSERELFTQILLTRANTDVTAGITGINKLNKEGLQAAFKYDFKAAVNRGLINARYAPLKTLQGIPAATVDALFKPVAFSNFIGDMSARYAIVLTLNNPSGQVLNFLTGGGTKVPKTVREALEYADEYIGFMDAKSELLGFASQYIRPFASYIMNYPGQVMRHAMRHPRRFHNALRYYNHNAIAQDRESNGYDKQSWQRNKMLVPVWTTPDGQRVHFDPGSVSGDLSAISLFDNTAKLLTRLSGGNTTDEIADLKARTNKAGATFDFLSSMLEGNYVETIVDAFTGADTFTGGAPTAASGYKTTTLFNIKMSPQLKALSLLVAPFANQLDRSLPPEIVGKRERRTADGLRILDEGVPGIFGNIPESGGYRGDAATNTTLGAVGLRPVYVDSSLAVVSNYNDLTQVIADGLSVQKYLISKGRQGEPEFAVITKAIYDAKVLQIDVDKYALENDVTPNFAVKEIKRLRNAPANAALKVINQSPGSRFAP